MRIVIRFFASLREIVGKKVENLDFPDGMEVTVEKILQRLVKMYKNNFYEYVFDKKTGVIQSYLTLLVNSRSITTLEGIKTVLSDGDLLVILPPTGGG